MISVYISIGRTGSVVFGRMVREQLCSSLVDGVVLVFRAGAGTLCFDSVA